MKNKGLIFGSATLVIGTLGVLSLLNIASSPLYTPREKESSKKSIKGAVQYYFDVKKNPETNSIDYVDVYKAIQEINQRPVSKAAALGLNWSELGPDNVGGRTRALLIDRNTPTKIFAGGVAGGLWVSTNSGANWSIYTGFLENVAITCITQAANGDIYFGTGEGLYPPLGQASAGVIGGGVWKSTDGGNTFSRLSTTIPTPNTTAGAWACVNQITAHPTNSSRIYAATSNGLMMTNDGGNRWFHPVRLSNGSPYTTDAHDLDIASDGTTIASISGQLYKSANGDSGSFVKNNTFPTGASRIEFAFAPSDDNYVYASAARASDDKVLGIYQSIDKGQAWTLIGPGGSWSFTPFGTSQGQGKYDNALAVSPADKGEILLGGVELWRWIQSSPGTPGIGQWNQAAYETEFYIPYKVYVHADKHAIKFHPTNSNIVYIGTDGGVFKSTNGGYTYTPMNNGYNVTQCYSIAFESNGVNGTGVMSGNQDNGSQYIDGMGNTNRWAEEIKGGDGGDVEISFINPNAFFAESQYGTLERSSNKGGSMAPFYPKRIESMAGFGGSSFTEFITPFALYESTSATNSKDSLTFKAAKETQTKDLGNGTKTLFTGTLSPLQISASLVPDSVVIKAGAQTVKDNAAGVLSGNGTGTFIHATGEYTVTFSTAPAASTPISIEYDVQYNPGSVLTLKSNTSNYSFSHTLTNALSTRDSVVVQDIVQSRLAIGFSGTNGVWLTKEPLNFSKTPPWFKIATITGTAEAMAWSPDGDVLYIGTSGGQLFRMSNMTAIVDSVSGDLGTGPTKLNSNYKQVKTQIAGFGRFITGLSVDPNNGNRVIVTLGGYGGTSNIWFSSTASTCAASSGTTNFSAKQGTGANKLPAMPMYDAIIEKSNPNTVIVGTEYGIYATSDITQGAGSISWAEENNGGLIRTPVFRIRQQTNEWWNVNNSGTIYIGTHGRGMWKDETYRITTGIGDNSNLPSKVIAKPSVSIYPNPLNGNGFVTFNLPKSSTVVIRVFDLQGKELKVIKTAKLQEGKQNIDIDSNELPTGTYLLSLEAGDASAATKFIVTK